MSNITQNTTTFDENEQPNKQQAKQQLEQHAGDGPAIAHVDANGHGESNDATDGDVKAELCQSKAPLSKGNADNLTNEFVGGADDEDADIGKVECISDFDEMQLSDPLLRGVYGNGFLKPSPVQARSIMPLAQGRDVVAQAQSGTGKTGAFAIGSLARIDWSVNEPQVLVLEPTRELAFQTERVYGDIGRHLGVRAIGITGGTSLAQNRTALRTAHVVVGTPGRIIDVVRRKWLKIDRIRVLIMDEADEMLSRGFIDDMEHIVSQVASACQIGVFSATFDPEAERLTRQFTQKALRVFVRREALTLAGIHQYYVSVDDRDKADTLIDIYSDISVGQSMIFVASRRRVDELCEALEAVDFTPARISGDLTHAERQAALERFRHGNARVLVATDLCARGIDAQGVSCVINFDMPRGDQSMATYLHRIGRAGRYGRTGLAISFVNERDVRLLRDVEQHYQTHVAELPSDFAAEIGSL